MPTPFPNLPPYLRGAVDHHWFVSRALRDNPLGDPAERDLYVYRPPDYDPSGATRYPVLLVLAPFASTGEALLARGLSDVSFASRCDRLISEGCPPFLAVLPCGMTRLGGSQWIDSRGIGRYATYLADDVLGFVHARYPTTRKVAAIGRSSGGFGALRLALDHPGAVQAVGSLAGDLGFDLCYLGDLGPALDGLVKAGGPEAFVPWFWAQERPSGNAFAALNLLCMAAAYDADEHGHARLPMDLRTGAVDFAALARWGAHDPAQREDLSALAALNLLFFDAGDVDEHRLQYGALRLHDRLGAAGIAHTFETFRGGHRGTSFRYDVAIPKLIAAISEP